MSAHTPTPPEAAPAVAVTDLRKSFGSVVAVDGATWSAHSGRVTDMHDLAVRRGEHDIRVGGDAIDTAVRIAEERGHGSGRERQPQGQPAPSGEGGDGRRDGSDPDCRESGTIDHPPSLG